MPRAIALALLTVLILSAPLAVGAQLPGVSIGDRVRVTSPALGGIRRTGTTVEINGDSIVIRFRDDQPVLRIPLHGDTRIEVGTPRPVNVARGATIGALAGGGVGAAVDSYRTRDRTPGAGDGGSDRTATIVTALVGALVGGGVAASRRMEWIPVTGGASSRARVTPLGVRGMALRIGF